MDFFTGSRGIHLGDPLSPLLFDLVRESLEQLVLKVQSRNLTQGLLVVEEGKLVKLMYYADDSWCSRIRVWRR